MYFKRGIKEISGSKKICIIGAGASGLTAAICAADRGASVCVLEHKPVPGSKLLLTGNGKCNITNMKMDASCYHREEGGRLSDLLDRYTPEVITGFFGDLGVNCISRFGYVYPEEGNAGTVLKALTDRCESLGVKFVFDCGETDINELRKSYDGIILACGGKSYKKTGSNGSGFKFLERLNVGYSRLVPALTALKTENDFCRENKGRRLICRVGVSVDGREMEAHTGEVQILENALSGIPVFNLSGIAAKALDRGQRVMLELSGEFGKEDIPPILQGRREMIKGRYSFDITEMPRFDRAQVTAGGVSLDDLTSDFELVSQPDVFVTGEMCDADGICGGYNLHFAWLSGMAAGRKAGGAS